MSGSPCLSFVVPQKQPCPSPGEAVCTPCPSLEYLTSPPAQTTYKSTEIAAQQQALTWRLVCPRAVLSSDGMWAPGEAQDLLLRWPGVPSRGPLAALGVGCP